MSLRKALLNATMRVLYRLIFSRPLKPITLPLIRLFLNSLFSKEMDVTELVYELRGR